MAFLKNIRSLRDKFLVAFLALYLLALALTIWVVSEKARLALEDQIQIHIRNTVSEHGEALKKELEMKWRWVNSKADTPFIVEGLTGAGGLAEHVDVFLRQLVPPGRGVRAVPLLLLNSRGRVVADNGAGALPVQDFKKEAWLSDVITYGNPRAELMAEGGRPLLVFAAPVFDGERVAGALAAGLSLDFAEEILDSEKAFKASLLTPAGRVLLGALPPGEALRLASLPVEPGKPLLSEHEGILYGAGVLDAPLEAGSEYLLVLSAPLSEINRPVAALRWYIFGIGAGIAALLAALVFWLSGTLLNPLRTLKETMEQILREGDLSRRAPVAEQDEVGVLSGSFNRMLDGLAEKNRQLALLAGITSTSPLPIMLVDEKMTIQVWNEAAEKLFGWRRGEIIGRSPFEMLVPEEEQEVVRRVRAQTDQSAAARYETVRLASDGTRIPVENISTRLKDADGRFMGNIVLYRDLREIRKLQASILQTEKMGAVGQLAAGVAHEINNPLGIILGFAQSLVKRIKADDPMAMPLKSIEREALRCKILVQDLLVFSRSTTLEAEELDLNEALTGALSLIFARARTRSVEIVQEMAPELPRILANRNKLQQVLINLANNAIDAMPEGGTLTIATSLADGRPGHVRVSVGDTGHGIPGAIRANVMDPFFTTKEAGKGTGLGLSLVYEIVKNHKGGIELESEEGKGTKFTIFLPVKD